MALVPSAFRELMAAPDHDLIPRGPTPEEFFDSVRECFHDAVHSEPAERAYRIGDRTVLLRFAGRALERLLTPALEHLSLPVPPEEAPGLTVLIFDTAGTGVAPPAPAWGTAGYGVRGEIAGFNTERVRTVYQPGSDVLLMIDRDRGEGIYWTADARNVPYWESSFPLRTIFHWWLEDLEFQPVHAAAVGLAGGGVLIAGPSGSGKSTTALACLDSELGYAGDDYVLVRRAPTHVYSLYGTAKLESENLARFPRLDALVYINSAAPEKMLPGFPIRAILVPRARAYDALPVAGREPAGLREDERAGAAGPGLHPGGGHGPGTDSGGDPRAAALGRGRMTGPLISVIVPAYNSARFLPEAIASIHCTKSQNQNSLASS